MHHSCNLKWINFELSGGIYREIPKKAIIHERYEWIQNGSQALSDIMSSVCRCRSLILSSALWPAGKVVVQRPLVASLAFVSTWINK